ncbi:hypothetical protein [Streptomyces europaeiscabiei]|uniref:hypothetical protein n=1 Tax=Streptomyces europaeiscabiei TaxID=146819 RepID=UPI00131CD56C|nr:hypothetical protein [Streptomyces europaeiscabiei]MDX2761019.1 hypothetical protein [Streptomyces europaeiscabiei]MDX3867572.1 hypothetical protein [Streptomyces europaeiscabiei]
MWRVVQVLETTALDRFVTRDPLHWSQDPPTAGVRTHLQSHLALRNVDAAVFWAPDGTAPATYRIGTGFGEVKAKFVKPGEIISEGDD